MAETRQFKAESKRLLEMMINSIYTHKEIFLRELISNASDAIDKLYFKSLTDDKIGMSRSDFKITVKADKDSRTLTITDNGIGMTAEELENNLGIIANSGSLAFKTENADAKGNDIDVIGQFGVGFYSAFMVAREVEVRTRAYGSDKGYVWKSEGVDGYTIDEYDKDSVGTEIILTIKDKTEDEDYDEYLSQWKIKSLVKKYSDYIRYPIMMDMVKTRYLDNDKDDENGSSEPKTEEYIETETLNSMVPIWKKNKNEVTEEEYNSFYKEKFFDYTDPLKSIHVKTEGTATYSALLYIPSKAPFDYYSKNYEKGLQLYSSGVLIMDKCADLLPDHFSFVRGLVDSEDLSLNISRELLQHDRQLKLIARSLERTIKNELKKMLTNEREKYEEFWKQFGIQVKFGVYNEYGSHKDILKDLLLFTSSMEKKLVTLDEYVSRMKEDQKYIYYASGDTADKIDLLPQIERFREKGIEVLYLTDSVDEFALKTLMNYEEKEFKSVSESGSELDSEEEKEAAKKASEENKELLESLKNALDGKVSDVVVSEKLRSHPVCLSNKGEISLEMEKILNSMPNDAGKVKAEKVLEINASHPVFEKLKALCAEDNKDAVSKYAKILYDEALLIEGMPIEDPLEFSKLVCELMV